MPSGEWRWRRGDRDVWVCGIRVRREGGEDEREDEELRGLE